jgi:GMP synthase-like glutamine amidotransferase/transcriptional antiterminator Rof (Rho-off)
LRALEAQGIQTQVIYPYEGEAYPHVSEINGIISLGGPMGANDEGHFPWIKKECELLKSAVGENLPTVGICLGGQLLAKALGAKIEKNGAVEVGWFPIHLTKEGKGDPIVSAGGSEPTVYHWHADTFHLPKDAVLLGKSKGCDRQAYKIGTHVYGFQFHPEADHQLVQEWMDTPEAERDIFSMIKSPGAHQVQDSKTQKEHSAQFEKSSLKYSSALSSLFITDPYDPIDCDHHDELESWSVKRTDLLMEFLDSKGNTRQCLGRIVDTFTIKAGEFIIFREENTTLWPIRLDKIKKLSAK